MLKKTILAFAAVAAFAAFGASSAQATLTDFGNPTWWTDGGNHITGTEDIYAGGTVTLTANTGLNTTCDLDITGSATPGTTMGEGEITGLTFTNCQTNAPGCTANAAANGLSWPVTLSNDGSESFLSVGNVSFTNTYTGGACVLGNGTNVTFTADHLDLTIPPSEESGQDCPLVSGHPSGSGGNSGFTADFTGSGIINGPPGSGITATAAGTVVICGDDVADLGVTG